jgi:hypothetical protein
MLAIVGVERAVGTPPALPGKATFSCSIFPYFPGFPWGISIRVETCGSGRKQKCGLLCGSTYKISMYFEDFFAFPGDVKNPGITRLLGKA